MLICSFNHFWYYLMKENKMGGSHSTYVGEKNAQRNLIGKGEGNRHFGNRHMDGMIMLQLILKKQNRRDKIWINVAQDKKKL